MPHPAHPHPGSAFEVITQASWGWRPVGPARMGEISGGGVHVKDAARLCEHGAGGDVRAGLLLAPPSEYSEEGARGGCCQQPICAVCLPTRLVSQAPTSLRRAAGEPFSQKVRSTLWLDLALPWG